MCYHVYVSVTAPNYVQSMCIGLYCVRSEVFTVVLVLVLGYDTMSLSE